MSVSFPHLWSEWALYAGGFTMGLSIDLTTNWSEYWPCAGDIGELLKNLYFTVFYFMQFLPEWDILKLLTSI